MGRLKVFIVALLISCLLTQPVQAATTHYVNYTFLNVRKSRSASSKLLGKLYYGDKVSVSSVKGTWAKIKYRKKTAYVHTDYLSRRGQKQKEGWICDDGVWDYWQSGKLIPSAWGTHEAFTKIKGTYSGTSYAIVVCKAKRKMYIFKAGNGWIPLKQIDCSIGKSSTPTPSGRFSLGYSMYRMDSVLPSGLKSTEFYSTTFNGDYCIHSTLYKYKTAKPDNSKNIDDRLGYAISNGCIRVSTDNARWIYQHCYSGTSLVIY